MLKYLVVAIIAFSVIWGKADAESPPPFKDFSAKRLKPPKPGTRKRITVQIDSTQKESVSSQKKKKTSAPKPQTTQYDWFWEDVPSDLTSASAGRLLTATRALSLSEKPIAVPRLQTMQDAVDEYGVDILRATIGTEVSPALVLAVMMVESAGKVNAVSRAGAQGLMQLMPATAARFGVKNSFASAQNITGGVKYLDWLMDTFERDPVLVLAGYNAGEGAVRKHSGVPPFAETRDYVPKVLAAYQVARGLCITPPELASDGCVFATLK